MLSELVGKSGLAILRSIVAGERDPAVLAQHRDGRVQASEADVARSLEGNWREEHLHELAAALRHFDFLEREIQQLELLIGQEAALLIVSELGADVSAFPTEKHFGSWLGLAPNNQISGGTVLRSRRRKANRLGQAFRQCAVTVRRTETWLGAKHRRRLARMEKARAVKATAHEIARLVYAMLRDGTEYVERSIEEFEKEY